jgi:hypothetical protein
MIVMTGQGDGTRLFKYRKLSQLALLTPISDFRPLPSDDFKLLSLFLNPCNR